MQKNGVIFSAMLMALLWLTGFSAVADEAPLSISEATIRLPLPGQTTAVVYLKLRNHSQAIQTVNAVEVESAGASELHQHIHRDGMMRMRRLETIAVQPESTLSFESGSYHIMAFRLATSTRSSYRVTLITTDGQRISSQATPVRL